MPNVAPALVMAPVPPPAALAQVPVQEAMAEVPAVVKAAPATPSPARPKFGEAGYRASTDPPPAYRNMSRDYGHGSRGETENCPKNFSSGLVEHPGNEDN
eukprot:9435317-Heterocapsa_arctica.AAC.1